jgi:hypothetical protein
MINRIVSDRRRTGLRAFQWRACFGLLLLIWACCGCNLRLEKVFLRLLTANQGEGVKHAVD